MGFAENENKLKKQNRACHQLSPTDTQSSHKGAEFAVTSVFCFRYLIQNDLTDNEIITTVLWWNVGGM